MIKKLGLWSLLTMLFFSASAQSDGTYDYRREFLWGINKSTTSGLLGGLVFRFANGVSEHQLRTIGFELINIKHPAEIARIPGSAFKDGKINYLYSIRGRYGRDFILFKKSRQQGVQINGHFAGGPTIGLESPYYIINGSNETVPYDPSVPVEIAGVGLPFRGLFESKVIPGVNLKGSLLFEFGTFKSNITGVEIGFNIEAFSRSPRLQFNDDINQSVFTAAFLNLFYGNRK